MLSKIKELKDKATMPSIDENTMLKVLDWGYEKALTGGMGVDSINELADDFRNGEGSLIDKANRLIRWQNTKAATTGFVSGLGGIITLPVAIPANVSVIIFMQIRMIAAIAALGGYDVRDDRVKTLVYACLTGNAVSEIMKQAGVQIGNKMASSFIQKYVTREILNAINKAVGFRLITKAGQTGVVNLGKMVPFVGGVIGGSFDAMTTNYIGNTARKVFIEEKTLEELEK